MTLAQSQPLFQRISIIPDSEADMTPKQKIIQAIQEYRATPGVEQAVKLERLLDYYVAGDTAAAIIMPGGTVQFIGDPATCNIEETTALYALEISRGKL